MFAKLNNLQMLLHGEQFNFFFAPQITMIIFTSEIVENGIFGLMIS